MGFWGGAKSFGANLATGGAYGANKAAAKAEKQSLAASERGKAERLANLESMVGPQVSAGASARLKALQEMQKAVPLSQNAGFQGERANLVQNARQEVAGIQNKQNAYGVQGGFSNVGSTQDAYDRLSAGLANLGQQAEERRDSASREYAELDQGLSDQQTAFLNEQAKLRDAILSGNLEQALAAYNNAAQMKANASTQGWGNVSSLAGSIGGGYLGGVKK